MTISNLDGIEASVEDIRRIRDRLEHLDADTLFRIGYSAYEYLRDLKTPVPSSSYSLLKRIESGDPNAILGCVTKMIEERDELVEAAHGAHCHNGETKKEIVLTELQQSIYWPILIAVGNHIPYENLRFIEFLRKGYEGKNLVSITVEELKGGCNDNTQNSIVLVRQTLVFAGNNMLQYNHSFPDDSIKFEDIANHDLKQMLQKDYLFQNVRQKLGV